ncbi:ZPR1 zinc finger domain-containing protein [Candidatus Woesearchaeota archaeon]|nr:ZPR1 zinc finger domain-containing protein [Candidatus Woesearchaeota archaeon]
MGKEKVDTLGGQTCPVCAKKTLTLSESEIEVPYFGTLLVFGMNCSDCGFKKGDVEAAEQKEPCKWTFEVAGKDDLSIRVIKSSEATVKLGTIGSIDPGPSSEGYVTNVEGLITRMKEQVEHLRDSAEEEEDKEKARTVLKKIMRVFGGNDTLKITIEDPSGNSAIISDKAKKEKLK